MRRAWWRSSTALAGVAALILVALAVGVLARSSDRSVDVGVVDEPEGGTGTTRSPGCGHGASRVPTPLVTSGTTGAPMDLLFVEHAECGSVGDGAANLGAEPSVIAADGLLRVEVPPDFDVRHALSSADADDAPLGESRAAGSSAALEVEVPDGGCHRLVVELARGGLTGRFVSHLETSDGACPRPEG